MNLLLLSSSSSSSSSSLPLSSSLSYHTTQHLSMNQGQNLVPRVPHVTIFIHSFIQSVFLRKVQSLYHSRVSTDRDPVLPLSITSTFSFSQGHLVAAYVFFLVTSLYLSINVCVCVYYYYYYYHHHHHHHYRRRRITLHSTYL